MFTAQTILHPTDFSDCARTAFRYAAALARAYEGTLHLLHVEPDLSDDPIRSAFEAQTEADDFYKETRDEADRQMKALIDEDASDIRVKRVHARGIAPGPVVIEYAEKEGVDLIIMGTVGRRGVKRLMMGSVAEEIVRHATCAVMTVQEDAKHLDPTIDRMLVPVDLSQFSISLLRDALEMASQNGAVVDLLHVVEPLPFPAPLVGAVTIHDLIPDPTNQTEKALRKLRDRVGYGEVEVNVHVREGHAAFNIMETAAELESDLIVMASHGLTGLEHVLLGSVTARVVRRAPCPVLTLRVEPEAEDAE